MSASIRIVGCGRSSMGDDQAGLVVAEDLRRRCLPDTRVVADDSPAGGLAEWIEEGVELLIVIDAARADAHHPNGSFARIDYRASPPKLRSRALCGTHALGIETGLELASALGTLPANVWIYAIFGSQFNRGLEMREDVAAAAPRLAERIENDVRLFLGAASCTS